jgi:3'(2'), 5'-bisphosphate nucleotidase
VTRPQTASAADHALARDLAAEAGAVLLEVRGEIGDADPAALKAEGDRRSHDFLLARLTVARPHDAVLSEEGRDDLARLDHDRVWIVDPLDGTREFSEPPRDDWAVHVALAIDGQPVCGAVSLPARGLTLSTADPLPAALPVGRRPRVVVSRTRFPEIVMRLTERLDGETVPMGSAGAKAMAVVLGDVDVYAHAGGQHEWDSCAPVAVALAAGLHASRIDGSPLRYNNRDSSLPDLLICRPDLVDRCLALLADLGAADT